ncbi:Uncharacterised protein [Burkholderia pseudomallei]|uniref:hypothetical protein n=1 Tax=Burkholderia pseudomallei TaxID=28450 RepID=UPI0005E706DE|nr:hypothetical protein [Burkholderia pseudomallei]CAJ9665285.1 Uncharacterised protein [Burkholderia pseudomallei]CAJ9684693.1 Uncharacterised protein [Burkholderia pseudomallei]CAK1343550.1 Uncharacterised protein [Burkholderia pseudomallei]CPF46478.1 Uncharacterised protein [Burkholderia pseudomallei]CPH25633.1 Uncharacterised protein [Burkholderia pseudomallei]
MTIALGIDPGIRGALAALDHNGHLRIADMPMRPKQGNGKVRNEIDAAALQRQLRELIPADEQAIVVMEALNTFAGGSVQTMASLEATKAVIATVCELSGYTPAIVTPQCWQRFYGIKRSASEDTKAQSLRLARDLYGPAFFPLAKHDGRADATLIARWAQRNLT